MRIEKYIDRRDLLDTRTRAFQIVDEDGTLYFAGRTDYLHDLPPVEWVTKCDTQRDLRPGSARFTRIMAACLQSDEGVEELRVLRRYPNVTPELEALADI